MPGFINEDSTRDYEYELTKSISSSFPVFHDLKNRLTDLLSSNSRHSDSPINRETIKVALSTAKNLENELVKINDKITRFFDDISDVI